MKRAVNAFIIVLAALVPVVSCAPSAPGAGSTRPVEHDTIVVEVNNQHFLDATIFVRFEAGPLRRLGLVPGSSKKTYVFQWQPRRFFFAVDLVGSGEFITDPTIVANPNDEFELRLPSNLDRGAAGFRRVNR